MNVRKRVEDHPLVVYLGLVIATVTATLGIALPLAQTAHDTEIQNIRLEAQQTLDKAVRDGQDALTGLQAKVTELNGQVATLNGQINDLTAQRSELEQSLSGIKRVLGGESDDIDVSRLVVSREEARRLPAASRFFAEAGFYALDVPDVAAASPAVDAAADADGWTYQQTTELKLLADQAALTEDEERAAVTKSGANPADLTRWPVHLWRRPGSVAVEGFPSARALYSQVFVQRAPIDAFLELQGLDSASVVADHNDALLLLLTTELIAEVGQGGQFLSGLQSIEQRGSTIYARFESVLRNVTVDGQAVPEYYWTRELMIVATPDDFYLVKTFLPNADHRSPDFARLTQWFESFAVLSDG